jgi:hypothetical protein
MKSGRLGAVAAMLLPLSLCGCVGVIGELAASAAGGAVSGAIQGSQTVAAMARNFYNQAPTCDDGARELRGPALTYRVFGIEWVENYDSAKPVSLRGPGDGGTVALVRFEVVNRTDARQRVTMRHAMLVEVDGSTTGERRDEPNSLATAMAKGGSSDAVPAHARIAAVAAFNAKPGRPYAIVLPREHLGDVNQGHALGCHLAPPASGKPS